MRRTMQGTNPAGFRRATWPEGGELTVRAMTPADVDGVCVLFAELSPDDRRYRFFAQYRPPREFVERMAATNADGRGYQLVATLEPPEPARIVAEAGYVLLDSGDGELGITVAAGSRGWVGPFILDALLEVAAERGVPNLEADILVENSRMLALARSRGYATRPVSDFTLLRVLIGAARATPSWPGSKDGSKDGPHRPRLLVEGSGGRWRAAGAAEAAGIDVIACPGPRRGQHRRCPVLAGEPCPLAAGADVIVAVEPGPDDHDRAGVLAAHATLHPGVPLCVEVPGATETAEVELAGIIQLLPRQVREAPS